MLEVCSMTFMYFISYTIDCILFKKLTNSKTQIVGFKNILLIIIMSIISCSTDIIYGDFFKLVFSNIQTCILLKLVFDKSFFQTIQYAIIVYILSTIAEALFVLIFIICMKIDSSYFMENIVGYWICNLTLMSLYTIFLFIPICEKFTKKILTFYIENFKIELGVLLIFIVVLISSITYPIIMKPYSFQEKTTFFLTFIVVTYFIINFFYQRSKNGELKKEYDYLLDYVKEYEKALDEKGKAQHEYKNQLIVIKGMVNKRNTKLHKYIDDMLDIEEGKEANILNHLKYIPTGGLKGLIYYKLEHMLGKNMEVHVNVDSALESKKYWRICEKYLQNISTIVGVYLDNAIEAAEKADNKYIIIDIDSDEENLVFSFSNTYHGHIDVGKMDKQGYSTKGKSRGYGLSLVQDILNKNTHLQQQREINGIFYVQKLIIQNKK